MFEPIEPGEVPTLGLLVVDWLDSLPGPFKVTDEQAQLLLDWYRLDPSTGERVYRRGQIQAAKGWGKSPLAGLVALAELSGPVVFDGWVDGRPTGRPWASPVIQIAAVSEDQAENTYGALLEFLTYNDGAVADHLGLDAGQTRILRKGQPAARIDAVTASAGTREGQRVTFAVLDESHLWNRGNGGDRLANTLRRNAGKMDGSTLETTNAYVPGEQSVAQATVEAATSGRTAGIFRWSRTAEVPSLANRAELRRGLRKVYGEAAAWVNIDRLIEEIYDPDTTEADARRFYLNEVVQHAGGAFDLERWASLGVELADDRHLVADGELITIGFDGARYHDSTALWGCRVSDGHLFRLGLWERPAGTEDGDWEVPATEVHAKVHQAMEKFDVWRMYADPPRWQDEIDSWAGQYDGVAVKWETYRVKAMAFAIRRFSEALHSGGLSHDSDEALTRHVGNAYKAATKIRDDDGRWLWRIEKEHPKSARKIDAAMAAILAFEARGDAIAAGAKKKQARRAPRRIR